MDRREKIIEEIKKSNKPISASKLATMLGVSRQIIVGDVALLRASGFCIAATPPFDFCKKMSNGLYRLIKEIIMQAIFVKEYRFFSYLKPKGDEKMKRKVLLPRSDTARWQIYPSDDEVLLVKMLTKYSELEKEAYLIRIMVNFFAEDQEMQLKLIEYARQYIRPKYDLPKSREARKKVAIAKSNAIVGDDIMNQVNYYISLIQELKNTPEKVEKFKNH